MHVGRWLLERFYFEKICPGFLKRETVNIFYGNICIARRTGKNCSTDWISCSIFEYDFEYIDRRGVWGYGKTECAPFYSLLTD